MRWSEFDRRELAEDGEELEVRRRLDEPWLCGTIFRSSLLL
jgi:hypothetical protein